MLSAGRSSMEPPSWLKWFLAYSSPSMPPNGESLAKRASEKAGGREHAAYLKEMGDVV